MNSKLYLGGSHFPVVADHINLGSAGYRSAGMNSPGWSAIVIPIALQFAMNLLVVAAFNSDIEGLEKELTGMSYQDALIHILNNAKDEEEDAKDRAREAARLAAERVRLI